MIKNIPEWATEKQKEGMSLFNDIAGEYGSFVVSYRQSNNEDVDYFFAVVDWDCPGAKDKRRHEFKIGWNYAKTWSHLGKVIEHWQFIFGDDEECTREVTSEIFYMDLFFYMDNLKTPR